ncbi:ribonucleotide-diphosphate reductase subunit alpha, partial [Patescibacteria group bacterium]|nr:ribonucleotide-diphosphate reductase subunit alpha [Patescibacteria group bacterium]
MAKYNNGIEDDWDIPSSSVTVLESRYLTKDNSGNVIETGVELLQRVAWDIAVAELQWDPEFKEKVKPNISKEDLYELAKHSERVKKTAKEFFELMKNGYFLPNSPTLMNAGKKLQQLSACFVLPIGDSIEEIFETMKNMAIVHKSGGGTGFSFSKLRPNGSLIKSTQGYSPGPLSFLFSYNESAGQITQGGKRRGANMGIIRANHPDALCFARIKGTEGVLSNFNLSIAFSDEEIEAVKKEGYIELKDPQGKEYTSKNAKKR